MTASLLVRVIIYILIVSLDGCGAIEKQLDLQLISLLEPAHLPVLDIIRKRAQLCVPALSDLRVPGSACLSF
jgi:hypothetical protein